jgi:arabinose-5-phosphate isomerase
MSFDFISAAKQTIELEAQAVTELLARIDNSFTQACQLILACKGKVVLTGMGKSGHIARKIAATLSSTGTPAFFVHPGEAGHGDMGMISEQDLVIAISNSGNTSELLPVINLIKRLDISLISLTGDATSTIATQSATHLDISVTKEACPLDLAPTSSTTATLVMGDALAVALLQARGFKAQDFARAHPGGALGRRLLIKVADIMHSGSQLPAVAPDATISEAILEMTAKGLGMTAIIDAQDKLLGIFTDGDLRRVFSQANLDIHTTAIAEVMITNCKTINADELAISAVNIMNKHAINAIIAVAGDKAIGALNMHDLLKEKII